LAAPNLDREMPEKQTPVLCRYAGNKVIPREGGFVNTPGSKKRTNVYFEFS
jgi:hypothetical protein